MTTDEKTPTDRPAAAAPPAEVKAAPEVKIEEMHPRDFAAYVRALPTRDHINGMEQEIATILEKLAALASKVEELLHWHTDLAGHVDAHGAELGEVHKLIQDIASAARARDARRPAEPRQLVPPSTHQNPLPVPGLELPKELLVDTTKPGTHLTTLPGGGVIEVNVRRPPAADRTMVRDGKPVTTGKKTRRS